MSVLQPISYGLTVQVGPGNGARGFGSYKADNTELIRPFQQTASSPFGRGFPISVVSGRPTVYDPYAGIKEDPIVVLLKKLLGEKTKVVDKAPDAGFMNNQQVYPPAGPAGNPHEGLSSIKSESSAATSDPFLEELTNTISSRFINESIEYDGVWDNWVDDVEKALDDVDSYYGLEKDVTSGSETSNSRVLETIKQLDDLLLETRVLNMDDDEGLSRRYRNATTYYAALAELTGEVTFDEALAFLIQQDDEGRKQTRKEIIAKLKQKNIEPLLRGLAEDLIRERTANQGTPSMYSSSGSSMSIDVTQQYRNMPGHYPTSSSSNVTSKGNTISSINYPNVGSAVSSYRKSSTSSSRRSSLLSSSSKRSSLFIPIPTTKGVNFSQKRQASTSSSSGNSSGISYKPGNDTSKAFDRPSRRKPVTKKRK